MNAAPIVLVPGWWLGAWAWDSVASLLRESGHEVTAVTLPGLESVDADRSSIGLADHVDAICAAVRAFDRPVVLAVHSGTGGPGYSATDRVPELVASMVYVDSGAGNAAIDPGFAEKEKRFPGLEVLAEEENLDGISDEQLATFARRAVPQPGGVLRDSPTFTNDARLDVPSTVICTAFPSDEVKAAVAEGYPWLGGLAELRDVTWVDLPTSHWPMWSKPRELAEILSRLAAAEAEPR